MAVIITELTTVVADIGFQPDDVITAGDSFAKRFLVREKDPPCDPADFTGFTWEFNILDSSGATLIAGSVTPSAGDATGETLAGLTIAQTTTLGDATNFYEVVVADGVATRKTLFCGRFKTTECPPQ